MRQKQKELAGCGAREASYRAILSAFQGHQFAADVLEEWQKKAQPSSIDFRFAQEISFGTVRMALSLDFLAAQLADKKKLSLKLKERSLLRMAIYQSCFMTKVPLYAIVDETVELAQRYCHKTFAGFLNAVLRKLSVERPELPPGDSISDISLRYSYPESYVKELVQDYGKEASMAILQAGNSASLTMVRVRSPHISEDAASFLDIISSPFPLVGVLKDTSMLQRLTRSSDYYIQNITPAILMGKLCEGWKKTPPEKILDLCASPGGKLIAVHDYFPKAELYANDVSREKVERLSENCHKYGINAHISCAKGEEYVQEGEFDIVILDVPCSNTGVLNKRAEARWRLDADNLRGLETTQVAILRHAKSLLSKHGEIWYMTCSILKRENEALIEKMSRELNLSVKWHELVLPNLKGSDGGFACVLNDPSRISL